ncbi:XisI protein [Lusitaniella coriacea LEGE 07157]|uniref:XisI protein n=1 Tax=Lusitaniella coriacea LEGE 07157 TaxID=945747 RepID=A0A8J7DUX5_9CYAN|nr:XisI protein [Lusitaniella coriacea]MBE9114995.1 XisI protein [Lusitaniella coriacea LEGE 07157]
MDTLANYRTIIKKVLEPHTQIPYSHGDLICKPVFDENSDSYLLVTLGWDKAKRIHGCLVHIDIINGKIWVQRDETEDGVTLDIVAAGIPKDSIVLGFHPADVRPHTGYAVV